MTGGVGRDRGRRTAKRGRGRPWVGCSRRPGTTMAPDPSQHGAGWRSHSPQSAYREALRLARTPKGKRAAVPLLEFASRQGLAEAQYALGSWYLYGVVVPRDLARANRLFTKAAAAGQRDAAFNLAVTFETGQGRRRNLRRAFRLYQAAAAGGDQDALLEVARCLYYGIGTRRNVAAALRGYRRAASKGSAEARVTLRKLGPPKKSRRSRNAR